MSRVVVSGEALVGLITELERMLATSRSGEVRLDALGKSLAAVTVATRGVFGAAGVPSMRMEAAMKALDLRTKKSELEAFVDRGSADA